MPDPMTWGVLAAQTAAWSVQKLANLAAGSARKDKVEPAFKRSGLDHELAGAYEAAFKGFVDVLRGPFTIDGAMDARLREMFADDGFKEILAELPRARFQDVEVDRARAPSRPAPQRIPLRKPIGSSAPPSAASPLKTTPS